MTKSRKPLLAVMRREQHSPFAVWLICFLVLGLFAAAPVWAADKTGSTHGAILGPIVPQSAPSPITPYVAQAYSVVGPISVLSVSSRDIVLYTGANNLGIDLTGKSVTVIDQNSQPLTLSAVKKGTSVYVCRKASNVVVVVLPDSNSTTIGEAKR